MNAVTIILVMLVNGGYWFAGDAREVSVQWVSAKEMPAAELVWTLQFGQVKLAEGKVAMPKDGEAARVALVMPDVRGVTELRWSYRLVRQDNGQVIEEGGRAIHLYPRDFLDGWAKVMGERKVMVCDGEVKEGEEGSLAAWLENDAKVKLERVKGVDALPLSGADVIVVGADELGTGAMAQSAVLKQAEAGAQVLMLAQGKAETLAGLAVVERQVPANLQWRGDHRLLARMDKDMLQTLTQGLKSVRAVEVGEKEPVLEVAWWPRAEGNAGGDAMECLMAIKQAGKGRVVICQVPLGGWRDDPRSQLLMANALEYLTTAPGAITPWGERRREQRKTTEHEQRSIQLP